MAKELTVNLFCKAIGLGFAFGYAWLILHCLTQWVFFRGGQGVGEDWGLGTFIPAWFFAAGLSLIFFGFVARRVLGKISVVGLALSGLVGPLIAIAAGFSMPQCYSYHPSVIGCFFTRLFGWLGLGILPEGRKGFSAFNAVGFLSLMGFSTIAIVLTEWRLRKRIAATLVVSLLAALNFAPAAYCYDVPSHQQFLTVEAAKLLNDSSNDSYHEILAQSGNMARGSGDEDSGTNSTMHFYWPPDGRGVLGLFPSARQHLIDADYWANAVTLYKTNQKDNAYKTLGHALHLAAQDMFSPPHVNNDPHIYFDLGILNFVPDSYEPWVAQHFGLIEGSALHKGAAVPDITQTIEDALVTNSIATYQSVRIPGALNLDVGNPASGRLSEMFTITAQALTNCTQPDFCTTSYVWTIPNYGSCSEHNCAAGAPLPDEHWWRAQNLSGESGEFYYFENPAIAFPSIYKDGTPSNGKSLAELWALDKERLVARGQEASAGLMKLFAKTVDPLAPILELHQNDLQGNPVPDGGFSGGTIFLHALDPTDADHPVASGIYSVFLQNLETGTTIFPTPLIPAAGQNPVDRTFSDLAEGRYSLTAYDGTGNQSAPLRFIAARTAPQFAAFSVVPDPDPLNPPALVPIAADGSTADRNVRVDVSDNFFSPVTVAVTGYDPVTIDTSTEFVELDGLDPGHYQAASMDPVGNLGTFSFEVRSFGPSISMFDIQKAWGNIPTVPKVITKSNAFTVTSAADIANVAATGLDPSTLDPPLAAGAFPPGTHSVTGVTKGGVGGYTLTATDALGQSSSLSWQVGNLSVQSIVPANVYHWTSSETFTADLTLTADSTFGIADVATYPTSDPTAITHVTDPSHLGTPDMTVTVATAATQRSYFYTDREGNNASASTGLQLLVASTQGFTVTAFDDGHGADISLTTTGASVDVEQVLLGSFSSMTVMTGPRVMIVPDTFTAYAIPVPLGPNVANVPISGEQLIGHVTISAGGQTIVDRDLYSGQISDAGDADAI